MDTRAKLGAPFNLTSPCKLAIPKRLMYRSELVHTVDSTSLSPWQCTRVKLSKRASEPQSARICSSLTMHLFKESEATNGGNLRTPSSRSSLTFVREIDVRSLARSRRGHRSSSPEAQ